MNSIKIYKCLLSQIQSVIEKDNSYYLNISNDNKMIRYCFKYKNYMVDIKTGYFYPILDTDFTLEIEKSKIDSLEQHKTYAVRFYEDKLDNEPHAFYYKEKANVLLKKFNKTYK